METLYFDEAFSMPWYAWGLIGLVLFISMLLAWALCAVAKSSDTYLEQSRHDRAKRNGIGRP